jgi:hypothetical protein
MLNHHMKTRLLVLPLILGSLVLAQAPDGGFRRGRANAGQNAPSAADMVARRVQMLTRFLSLDASQQTQVTTLLTDQQSSLAINAPTLRDDRKALLEAIKTNNTGQIDVVTAKIANEEAQQNAIRSKTAASIYALLNADQKTKVGDALRGIMDGPGPGPGFRRGPRR